MWVHQFDVILSVFTFCAKIAWYPNKVNIRLRKYFIKVQVYLCKSLNNKQNVNHTNLIWINALSPQHKILSLNIFICSSSKSCNLTTDYFISCMSDLHLKSLKVTTDKCQKCHKVFQVQNIFYCSLYTMKTIKIFISSTHYLINPIKWGHNDIYLHHS